MACPMRKDIIKKKREERADKERAEKPWAEVVKKTTEASARKEEAVTQQLVGEMGLRALVMLMDAHVHNFIEPGSFNTRINQSLALNNITNLKLPDTPDSSKLIIALGVRERVVTEVENERKRMRSDEEQRPAEEEGRDEEEVFSEVESILDMHLLEEESRVKDATDIGVEILTVESWCHKGLEPCILKNMSNEGRVKYRLLERCRYDGKEISDMISGEQLRVPANNAVTVSSNVYSKIKTGTRYVSGKKKPPAT